MTDLIQRAGVFATTAHAGQHRKFGDRPYIYHPNQVYIYLGGRDYATPELLAAAWLHDVIEDCGITAATLTDQFGEVVARLVVEVSHPETPAGMPRRERWSVYLRHYRAASQDGQRLKLADRLCNLQEYLDYWNEVPEKERQFIRGVYCNETDELTWLLRDADRETADRIVEVMEVLLGKP